MNQVSALRVCCGFLVVLGGCSSTQRTTTVDITPEAVVEDEQCQDVSTTLVLDEEGDRDVVPPPQYEEVARGLEAYEAGSYEDAALFFLQAVENRAPISSSDAQLSQYYLAKTLYHLGFFHSALFAIHQIQEDPNHLYFPKTLPFLAVLSQHLPNEQHVLSALVGPASDVRLPSSANDEISAYLSFLRGKAAYHQSDHDRARSHLALVDSQWRWSVEARFYLAMIAVRQQRPHEALRAFQDMGHSSIQQEQCGLPERRALRDLAALSIGRLLFSGAQTENAHRAALRAYAGIGAESPHRSQATFERAWVHFQLGEDDRSLVLLEALPEPFARLTPEVATLRATIALSRCDLDGAHGLTTDFQRRWRPVIDQLNALSQVEGSAVMNPPRQSLAGELALRELASLSIRGARDCLQELDAEQERLETVSQQFRSEIVGERISMDISMARATEGQALEERVRLRYQRLVGEISALYEEMVRLEAGLNDMRSGSTTCSEW